MILLETPHYRIERFNNTPKPVALDRKEIYRGHTCCVNVGWYDCKEHAITAMAKDVIARLDTE